MNYKRSIFFKICKGKFSTVVFLVFLFWVLTAGGISAPIRNISSNPVNSKNSEQEISFAAEVKWISLEGGFYGLVAEDGRKFLPLNLPEEFKKDGLKVRIRGKIKKDIVTVYMWGIPLEILEIEILSSVSNSDYRSILTELFMAVKIISTSNVHKQNEERIIISD